MRPRDVLPRGLRVFLRQKHRALVLRRALGKLRRDPRGSDHVWRELVYGWGNAGFSSEPEYLDAVAAEAAATRGAILECGSGLTTLVLTTIAAGEGRAVWSLEADPNWWRTIQSALRRLGLSAELRLAPLRDYGDFDWYDVEALELPLFSLVVCDGPAGRTRGGRFGLVPVLGDRLEVGCTILLDDAERPGEREVLRRWGADVGLHYELRGREKPYAVARVVSDARESAPTGGGNEAPVGRALCGHLRPHRGELAQERHASPRRARAGSESEHLKPSSRSRLANSPSFAPTSRTVSIACSAITAARFTFSATSRDRPSTDQGAS